MDEIVRNLEIWFICNATWPTKSFCLDTLWPIKFLPIHLLWGIHKYCIFMLQLVMDTCDTLTVTTNQQVDWSVEKQVDVVLLLQTRRHACIVVYYSVNDNAELIIFHN